MVSIFFAMIMIFARQLQPGLSLVEDRAFVEKDGSIESFLVMRPPQQSESYLVILTTSGILKVYDTDGNTVFRATGAKQIIAERNSHLYFVANELTVLDLPSFTSKSVKLPRYDYSSLEVYQNATADVLVAGDREGVDVFSLPTGQVVAQAKRAEPTRFTHSMFLPGMLIFHNRENELAAFRINHKTIAWRLNSGSKPLKFLGISLKSVPNIFNQCEYNDQDGILYAATMFGDLYKIDPSTGNVLTKLKQFRGTDNNAGLLSHLNFSDIDGDNQRELIAPSVDHNIYCLSARDFSLRWQYDTGNENQMPLGFSDITGDGKSDISLVNDYDLRLCVLDGQRGRLLASANTREDDKMKQTSLVVANYPSSKLPQIIVKSKPDKLRVFRIK